MTRRDKDLAPWTVTDPIPLRDAGTTQIVVEAHAAGAFERRSSTSGVTGNGFDTHRPLWVKLSLVFPRRPDRPRPTHAPDPRAVDTTAEMPGDLLQRLRAATGDWLGLVTYQLPFADERHQRVYLERQLLPRPPGAAKEVRSPPSVAVPMRAPRGSAPSPQCPTSGR
jgi:hypothetical protein